MTKNKQRGNPKFSFLFGGPQHDFYNRCVAEERASKYIDIFTAINKSEICIYLVLL